MAYTKASHVLPPSLLEAIQDYVDGETLYIPRKPAHRKAWGETKDTKRLLAARNAAIITAHGRGTPVKHLAETHHLSVKAIYKILAAAKTN